MSESIKTTQMDFSYGKSKSPRVEVTLRGPEALPCYQDVKGNKRKYGYRVNLSHTLE